LLVRLGAFPVRRGEADADPYETARTILAAGDVVVLFREGTRVDEPDVLGSPHHGAARLGRETGAPILPTALYGTSRLWLGPIPKPRHVRIAILPAVDASSAHGDPDALNELIERRVWPAVRDEYARLQATPGVVVGALTALGVGTRFLALRRRAATPPRVIGLVPPRRLRRPSAVRRLLERLPRRR